MADLNVELSKAPDDVLLDKEADAYIARLKQSLLLLGVLDGDAVCSNHPQYIEAMCVKGMHPEFVALGLLKIIRPVCCDYIIKPHSVKCFMRRPNRRSSVVMDAYNRDLGMAKLSVFTTLANGRPIPPDISKSEIRYKVTIERPLLVKGMGTTTIAGIPLSATDFYMAATAVLDVLRHKLQPKDLLIVGTPMATNIIHSYIIATAGRKYDSPIISE